MDYIITNWSQLNTVDRFWFVTGIWLMGLFLTVGISKIFRRIFRRPKAKGKLGKE